MRHSFCALAFHWYELSRNKARTHFKLTGWIISQQRWMHLLQHNCLHAWRLCTPLPQTQLRYEVSADLTFVGVRRKSWTDWLNIAKSHDDQVIPYVTKPESTLPYPQNCQPWWEANPQKHQAVAASLSTTPLLQARANDCTLFKLQCSVKCSKVKSNSCNAKDDPLVQFEFLVLITVTYEE